jgi:hypothetical protein
MLITNSRLLKTLHLIYTQNCNSSTIFLLDYLSTMEGERSSDRLADVSDVVDVNLERSRDRLQRSENKRRSEKTQNSRRSRSENDDNTSDKGSRY